MTSVSVSLVNAHGLRPRRRRRGADHHLRPQRHDRLPRLALGAHIPRADPVHRVDGRARLGAATDNADLYEAVFRAHRLSYQRDTALLLTPDTPPPFFLNLIALDPDNDPPPPEHRAIADLEGQLRRRFSLSVIGLAAASNSPHAASPCFSKPPGSGAHPTPSTASPRRAGSRSRTPAIAQRAGREAAWSRFGLTVPDARVSRRPARRSGRTFFGRRSGIRFLGCRNSPHRQPLRRLHRTV